MDKISTASHLLYCRTKLFEDTSHLFPRSHWFTLPGLDSICKSVTVLSGNPRLWDLQWGFLCENMLIKLMSDWPDCVLLSCLLNTMWKAPCNVSMTNTRDHALMSVIENCIRQPDYSFIVWKKRKVIQVWNAWGWVNDIVLFIYLFIFQ